MSWLTVMWSMSTAACIMLAAIHGVLWLNDRRKFYYVLSSLACAGAASSGLIELLLMKAASLEEAHHLML